MQLSGGQQQRVAIARAMVSEPVLLLADEPTGNLDSKNSRGVLQQLNYINNKGTTIIMVTHSEEASRYGSRIITMKDGGFI
ncbi:ABC transporter ATP-binding protein [Yersinia aleksiciae]|uniref:ABC transporter ATP-binding protein n=2 Tax=Yersinia aleksiciae TaxID=263819 RepID=A0A0T9UEB5_YERAE|nr:ABC transporter ATP-binding protein [Yersinia aleksiciae]